MRHLITHPLGVTKTFIAVAGLLVCWAATTCAKEWRGIVPLRSTRADVERLLGEPGRRVSDFGSFYDFKDVAAVVWFETTGCEGDTLQSRCGWGWNVPRDTVTGIGVAFKSPQPLPTKLTLDGVKREESCAGLVYLENSRVGSAIEIYRGKLLSVTYTPTEAEAHLRCPVQPELCRISPRKIDEYGNIRWADEKARLDNAAVELQNSPDLRLAILAYGGRRGKEGEAIRRAERAKNYLMRVRRIPPWQIVAADCGYREDLTVELLPLGLGATRIYPVPTVDPREVRPVPKRRTHRRNRNQQRRR